MANSNLETKVDDEKIPWGKLGKKGIEYAVVGILGYWIGTKIKEHIDDSKDPAGQTGTQNRQQLVHVAKKLYDNAGTSLKEFIQEYLE
jgi:hypothetical protein